MKKPCVVFLFCFLHLCPRATLGIRIFVFLQRQRYLSFHQTQIVHQTLGRLSAYVLRIAFRLGYVKASREARRRQKRAKCPKSFPSERKKIFERSNDRFGLNSKKWMYTAYSQMTTRLFTNENKMKKQSLFERYFLHALSWLAKIFYRLMGIRKK